jgi:UDP-N-acetylglucosamine 1-carboxyvinyltransferase
MDKIRIRGGRPLHGKIAIGGAKNAALPLMCASLLTDETLTLSNIPHLADITMLAELLSALGVDITMNGGAGNGGSAGRVLSLNAARSSGVTAPYDLVRKMRASVLVLGPLIARSGRALVSQPGGCAIGTRPVDLHLKGLRELGAEIELAEGYIHAEARDGLKGADIRFPTVTVGGTENLLMAAVLAKGTTRLLNAAREPEVCDLARCLVAMGARIEGIGTDCLMIEGVERLHGAHHAVLPDRIEAGTYSMAAAITGGQLELAGAGLDTLEVVAATLIRAGVDLRPNGEGFFAGRGNRPLRPVEVETAPYPGFPTDLQAQLIALVSIAEGTSRVTETIFENRFMHVPELLRMGADIELRGASAIVRGVPMLSGAPVMASDLRASASLVLAALAAEGETTVNRVYHLDRGYERMEAKLAACGADIERIS